MTSSLVFWLVAFVLLACTLMLLVVPLLRRSGPDEAPAADAAATAVFRDHKRQIDDDLARGVITKDERDAALRDLTARFGSELEDSDERASGAAVPAGNPRTRVVAALAIVACLPAIAGALYLYLGQPGALNVAAAPPVDARAGNAQVAEMIEGLAKRLKSNPEDGEGWAMLGRSYHALGQFQPAADAYGEAAKRLPPSAGLYTDWAEALGRSRGRTLIGEPTELLNRALAIDPGYQKALALSGAAASERNDAPMAIALWTRLRAQLNNGSPEAAQVDAVIASLAARAGSSSAAVAPSGSQTSGKATTTVPDQRAATISGSATAATAAQSAMGTAAAGGPATPNPAPAAGPANAAAASIEGTVKLAPSLAARAAPTDVVFIFARDPKGGRMPLAAMKITVAELPKTFALTDAMAMSPAATLSKAASIVVEARIAKSGGVTAQPGDLMGRSGELAIGARNVQVTIDQVVP